MGYFYWLSIESPTVLQPEDVRRICFGLLRFQALNDSSMLHLSPSMMARIPCYTLLEITLGHILRYCRMPIISFQTQGHGARKMLLRSARGQWPMPVMIPIKSPRVYANSVSCLSLLDFHLKFPVSTSLSLAIAYLALNAT